MSHISTILYSFHVSVPFRVFVCVYELWFIESVHIWNVNKSNLFSNGATKPKRPRIYADAHHVRRSACVHPNSKESNGKYWIMRIHLIGMTKMTAKLWVRCRSALGVYTVYSSQKQITVLCHLCHINRGFFSYLENSTDFVAKAFVFQFTTVWLWHPVKSRHTLLEIQFTKIMEVIWRWLLYNETWEAPLYFVPMICVRAKRSWLFCFIMPGNRQNPLMFH